MMKHPAHKERIFLKLFAFLKKDLLVTVSYRFRMVLQFGGMFVSILMLYYIGRTFGSAISPYLERYGGTYFPYALIGIAVSSFVSVGLNSLSREIRTAQIQGTLESLLSTPTSIFTILIGNSLWNFLSALAGSVIMLSAGVVFLKLRIGPEQIFTAMLILILTFIAFLAVGMLSATFIMIFKQGDPITFVFGMSSYFFGGVLFPVEVLPKSFQIVSTILPITHAIKALREILLATVGFNDITPLLARLTIFIVAVGPVSMLSFRYAIHRAKKDGSLIQF